MSNYARKWEVKNATGGDLSHLSKRVNLASLNSKVNKLDVDKLETIPANLSELSNVLDKNVVKKDCI